MRKLVVTENITVDGVIAPMDGWFDPTDDDPDLLATTTAHSAAADAVVLGKNTYEAFASYWPHRTDDPTGVSAYLDRVAKYVVSTTIEKADWENTTILRDPAELAALKEAPGRDIVVTGSVRLVHSLLPTGLVDEFRLFVYPVVQGYGERLFAPAGRTDLTLATARAFGSGVVLLTYAKR